MKIKKYSLAAVWLAGVVLLESGATNVPPRPCINGHMPCAGPNCPGDCSGVKCSQCNCSCDPSVHAGKPVIVETYILKDPARRIQVSFTRHRDEPVVGKTTNVQVLEVYEVILEVKEGYWECCNATYYYQTVLGEEMKIVVEEFIIDH